MNYNNFLAETFMFGNLSPAQLNEICSNYKFIPVSIARGEKIDYSRRESGLCFVLSGRLGVTREKDEGGRVVINRLKRGSVFGLLSVFSSENYPTDIVAEVSSEILLLEKNALLDLMEKYPEISKNIIYFMADRINFLNKTIATFSGTRACDRLFSYLLSKAENEGSSVFALNCKKCSEAINAGRASVYRALETLVKEGVILFENKTITLLKKERY